MGKIVARFDGDAVWIINQHDFVFPSGSTPVESLLDEFDSPEDLQKLERRAQAFGDTILQRSSEEREDDIYLARVVIEGFTRRRSVHSPWA